MGTEITLATLLRSCVKVQKKYSVCIQSLCLHVFCLSFIVMSCATSCVVLVMWRQRCRSSISISCGCTAQCLDVENSGLGWSRSWGILLACDVLKLISRLPLLYARFMVTYYHSFHQTYCLVTEAACHVCVHVNNLPTVGTSHWNGRDSLPLVHSSELNQHTICCSVTVFLAWVL